MGLIGWTFKDRGIAFKENEEELAKERHERLKELEKLTEKDIEIKKCKHLYGHNEYIVEIKNEEFGLSALDLLLYCDKAVVPFGGYVDVLDNNLYKVTVFND